MWSTWHYEDIVEEYDQNCYANCYFIFLPQVGNIQKKVIRSDIVRNGSPDIDIKW